MGLAQSRGKKNVFMLPYLDEKIPLCKVVKDSLRSLFVSVFSWELIDSPAVYRSVETLGHVQCLLAVSRKHVPAHVPT